MNNVIPDPEDIGKLFVGGLSSLTTKESLQNYFSQYGEVVDSIVMKNMETGRSRGFGFVTFKDPNCVFKALQLSKHELDGKMIDPKECTPRSMQKARKEAGKCKIFMGGLPPDITEEAIRSGMSQFGKVDQVVIMFDQETKKCRGFGFLSFELEESINQVCAERYVKINGKKIECKRAEPRINPKRFAQSFASPKDQNGFVGQSSYGQFMPVQQSNWNVLPSQPSLYDLQGKSLSNYQTYGTSPMSFNTSSPGYPSVQQLPYLQQYGTPVATYNYSPVSSNTYTQASLTNSASNVSLLSGDGSKTFGSNDFSQNQNSYGQLKGTYISGNADGAIINQGVMTSSNYQRYHPYKV